MTKTLEQMAEEYGDQNSGGECSDDTPGLRDAFLAGYQAAKDQFADADKVMFCVYCNDMHKGNCAIGKGKNHPAVGFSKIVVKIESSWVSVKDRLPEDGVEVLVVSDGETGASWHEAGEFGWAIGGTVTHWAPLPAAPKEEV